MMKMEFRVVVEADEKSGAFYNSSQRALEAAKAAVIAEYRKSGVVARLLVWLGRWDGQPAAD